MKKIVILIYFLLSSVSSYSLTAIKNIDIQFLGFTQNEEEIIFNFSCRNNMNKAIALMLDTGRSYEKQEENILFLIPDSHFLSSKWISPNSIKFATQLKLKNNENKKFSIRLSTMAYVRNDYTKELELKQVIDLTKLQILNITFLFFEEEIKFPKRISDYESLAQNKGLIYTGSFIIKN